jgi:serine/threonine protein kinase/tetratricopeptide (TPR) repeat protein
MKCANCQSDNPDTQSFCGECGAQLKTVSPGTRTLRTSADDSTHGEIVSEKYKLLEELGSGGMGVVYKAEQIKPVKRSVALKIIKLGMDTKQVVARFETERQALAVMDHPNIAKIYDGGATETGRPYFVMELVRGIPITEYCDKHKLTTKERMELFVEVCEAVQHAHQKGVIHRDLKPSNILVAIQEEKPVPKIIDFGIAKATEHSLSERTLFTEQGQLIGTPEFMSPEQAEMSGLDVDTRTDIYSLGVILYKLLVGVLPFDPETLRSAGFGEIQRIIREKEPPKASTRLTGLGEVQTSVAQHRNTDVISLRRELKGDLDWIMMKAMAKDRTRRYASPLDLASDLLRHLRHEPVVAGPPNTLYRMGKFVRRHRIGVSAVAGLFLILVAVSVLMAVQASRIARERDRANREAAVASRVSQFLIDIFRVSDPSEARGNSLTAREILERGAQKIQDELSEEPQIKATLMDTIGVVYHSIGLFDEALPLFETALEIRQQVLGNENLKVAESQNNLGALLTAKGDYQGAESHYRGALATRRKLLGDESIEVAGGINNLATLVFAQGDYTGAEELFREALDMHRKLLGEKTSEVAETLNNLAMTLARLGQLDEAETMYRGTLELHRELWGDEHPEVARSLNNLGMCLFRKGEYEPAEPLIQEALAMNRKLLGEEHPEISTNMNNLARIHLAKGDDTEAESLFRKVLELDRKLLGERHPYVAGTLNFLADLLMQRGDHGDAEPLIREALSIQGSIFSEDHWQIAASKSRLGKCLTALRRYDEAEPLLLECYPVMKEEYSEDHQRTKDVLEAIIRLYEAWGKPEKADEYRSFLR